MTSPIRDRTCTHELAGDKSLEKVSHMHGHSPAVRPGHLVIGGTLMFNTAIFSLWQLSKRSDSPQLARSLHWHTLCSRSHVQYGLLHTMVTSSASHQRFGHFICNTYGLGFFGSVAATHLSAVELVTLLAVSGIGASGFHLLLHPRVPVLGGSGALMGVLAADALLEPDRQLRLLPSTPETKLTVSMLQVADFTLLANCVGFLLRRRALPNVAWAAHLGGTAAGIGFATSMGFRGDTRFEDALSVHSFDRMCDWGVHLENSDVGRKVSSFMDRWRMN